MGLSAACVIEEAEDDDEKAYCGDGKLNPGEQCDGTEFESQCGQLGFDEGEVTCDSSCKVETVACVILDEDLDGLNIYDEQALGTDPLNPDTDGDGILDGDEVAGGADPLNIYSWPQGVGKWPNRLAAVIADGVEGGGSLPGQVIWNYGFKDQFDQEIQLYQFYGYKIVVSIGAVWCPPCREASSTAQALWDQHRETGVIFIEQLLDGINQGVPPTAAEVERWASDYGLQYPTTSSENPMRTVENALPTFYIINSDLTVSERIAGWGGDASITAALAKAY